MFVIREHRDLRPRLPALHGERAHNLDPATRSGGDRVGSGTDFCGFINWVDPFGFESRRRKTGESRR